ncbi:hypothetical protein CR513_23997, partial [Mucuna pruriens]
MYQGFKSVEEYYKDCEVALLKANVLESNCIRQFELNLNKGGVWSKKRLTPAFLPVGEVRKERRNGPGRTRVQRRGVPYHEAKKKNIHHLAVVHHPKAIASSAWGEMACYLPMP